MPSRAIASVVTFITCLSVSVLAQVAGVRDVTYSSRGVIDLNTQLRYSTMIVLPDTEEILDVVCGDKDLWVINFSDNRAYVKPTQANSSTNLNLLTASGTVYSFLLGENAKRPGDLKVYVANNDLPATMQRKLYPAAHVARLEEQIATLRTQVEAAQRQSDEAIAAYRKQYPATLHFDYAYERGKKPFQVQAIWSDGEFTFIRSDARELPALYEMKDGKPTLVQFSVERGTYRVPKVLERGYLAAGAARLEFSLEER